MTDTKAVMQQALDALLGYKPYSLTHAKEQCSAIIALRAAIAQPEQAPVLYQFQTKDKKWHSFSNEAHYKNTVASGGWPIRALYTSPQVAQPEQPAPYAAIASILNEVMELAVKNGANSVSMLGEYVAVALWLSYSDTAQPEQPILTEKTVAYICQGCGGIYWAEVNCDCNTKAAFDMVLVSPIAQPTIKESLIVQAAAQPAPVRQPLTMNRYRLLERGVDTLQAGDEFLAEDCVTWTTYGEGAWVGAKYQGDIFLPARRAIEAAHGIAQLEQTTALGKVARDAITSLETISKLAGVDDYMQTVAEVRGYASSRATAARQAIATIAQPAEPSVKPVAWVDVKDRHEGPYKFHGIEFLDSGRHNLYTSPQIAQPEQPAEPVAWMLTQPGEDQYIDHTCTLETAVEMQKRGWKAVPLYAAPQFAQPKDKP